eukprot:TRINITY_DN2001_c0_g1_i1.p1 TRINITY_DN2001_c0_g1~~TRINITY_DN2001_c0_g1_i1.p1  ORF type:complete len:381 (+),score=125.71 TRINITY_DN2001_c0_g1_i1:45-1187(+)
MFQPAPLKGPLNVYRLLSKSAAVRVSPLCFGAMNIGEAWAQMMGAMDKKQSFDLLDYFFQEGGNFIDTACNYQEGQSEKLLGEWMEERGIRDQIVLATKFSSPYNNAPGVNRINYAGNSRKTLHIAVEDSLKKLKTSYIDILFVHWWDYTSTVEEMMPALDALVKSGKVLYLGISDAPAWVVAKANMYARMNGMSQFVVYQGTWSVVERDIERDIIPMCKDEGMAMLIWGALGAGKFKTQEEIAAREKTSEQGRLIKSDMSFFQQSENDKAAVVALDKISKETGYSLTSVALAWVMAKTPYVVPIVGGRKIEHLKENIRALTLKLTKEQIKQLDGVVPLHLGFPYSFFGTHASGNFLIQSAGHYQWVDDVQPIAPFSPSQ